MNILKKLPEVSKIKRLLPLPQNLARQKQKFDEQIKQNIMDKTRLAVVTGPCSADDVNAVTEFCKNIKPVADSLSSKLLTVARIYTTKPHSDGNGYKGLAFYDNDGQIDMTQGIINCRTLMLKCLQIGLPIADELLYPQLYEYFSDLVSWWFLGARSSQDTFHRSFASGLECAVGVKNAVGGGEKQTVQSVYSVTQPSVFPFGGNVYQTTGNPYAHAVLRGTMQNDGYFSNIDGNSIKQLEQYFAHYGMHNVFILADLSHANSGKNASKQMDNVATALSNKRINGIMTESYLYGGSASIGYGISKTDDCLDLPTTIKLLKYAADNFQN